MDKVLDFLRPYAEELANFSRLSAFDIQHV